VSARFAEKGVFVTGASRGLGRALALGFAAQGARVGVGYHRRDADASEVVTEIEAAGGSAVACPIDVRDYQACVEAIDAFIAWSGSIDVLVNNAGANRDAYFAMASPEDWAETRAVNLDGPVHVTRAAVRPMMGAGTGCVINVASTSAVRAMPGQAIYAAQKAGVLALTRSLARELAPKGIRVNAVVPGLFDAGMTLRMQPRYVEQVRGFIPAGRLGDARELVEVVCFLASDAASYVTGQALAVDGGLTA
jgi:3-oxoacyl-[acyl-carrier protein] reductase